MDKDAKYYLDMAEAELTASFYSREDVLEYIREARRLLQKEPAQ